MTVQHSPQLPLALTLGGKKRFDNFIVATQASDNLFSQLYALANASIAQLFLCGEAASGKSHLLEACVANAEEKGARACLLSGKLLAKMPVDVLEGLDHFDLIAIDDVDYLAMPDGWQEALFHFYNRAQQQGVCLLLAARQSPGSGVFTLKDLASRLAAGSVVNLERLDDDGLIRLIKLTASERGLAIHDELAHYMLSRAPRQPDKLLAMIEQLDKASLADKRRLTIPFVKQQMDW